MGRLGLRACASAALALGLGFAIAAPQASAVSSGTPEVASAAAGKVAAAPAKGSITGRVTDDAGRPLEWIGILVATPEGQPVGTPDFPSTGSDGTYTVSGLAAGQYMVCFMPNDTYSHECLGDAPFSVPVETLVTVRGSQKVRGVDAVLSLKVSLGGRVTAPSGEPVPDSSVLVKSQWGELMATTDADGRYVVEQIDKGTATLCVTPPAGALAARCWKDVAPEGAMTAIEVGASDLVGYDVTLPIGGSVAGVVTSANGSPLPQTVVRVSPQDPVVDLEPRIAITGADGSYEVAGLVEGPYIVCFEPTDLLAQPGCLGSEPGPWGVPVNVTLGEVLDGTIALAAGGAITGTVVSTSGQSLVGRAVDVTSEDYRVSRGGWIAEDGTYSAGGLPAGQYRVCGPNWVCLPGLVTVTTGVVTSSIDLTVP